MKVLHIITRMNQGGTARWLEKLSVGLSSAGWESIIVAGVVGQNEVEDSSFESLNGMKVLTLGKGKGPINDIRAFFQLRKIIMNEKPDVVNTHTSKAGVIGRLAAISITASKSAIIHTFHGHLLYGYFSKPITKMVVLIEKCMLTRTDHLIAAGKSVRNELILSGIGSEVQYSIIKPGVDSGLKLNPEVVRKNFGIPSNSIVVGWMGRFEDIKAPKRVLELAEYFPSVTFLMAGNGSLFSKLMEVAPINLLMPGWCDANEVWSVSNIALLTSENEALPIVLIEAGLAGIPAVAENVGAVSEVIIDKNSGFLCNSLEERLQALSLLIKEDRMRSKMGANAREFCISEFSSQKFIDDHIKVYLSVIPT